MEQLFSWGKMKTSGDNQMYPIQDQNMTGAAALCAQYHMLTVILLMLCVPVCLSFFIRDFTALHNLIHTHYCTQAGTCAA